MHATPDPFVQHCLELLSPLGTAHSKRMFGGHGVYLDGLFIGLVARDQLYLKVDAVRGRISRPPAAGRLSTTPAARR